MATRHSVDPVKSPQRAIHLNPPALVRLLMLPIVLGCCVMAVCGAMEEMMIAPIEVIEEWGCYDTEVRLTCGNLESKIAILEARFTPRCLEKRTENCIYMDEHSVTHPFASQKVDKLILEETEAGRRFLATMRRNHEKEREDSAEPSTRQLTREGGQPLATRSLAKDKRSSLRATLEHLIVRYLRRLTSDDDVDGDDGDEHSRYRRAALPVGGSDPAVGTPAPDGSGGSVGFSNSMEITLLTNDTDTNLTQQWDAGLEWTESRETLAEFSDPSYAAGGASDGATGDRVDSDSEGANGYDGHRVNGSEVAENPSLEDVGPAEVKVAELRQRNPRTGKPGECGSVRKRISQLNRFEMERSMRNGSFREYNIRNALNYRCSGKNHCSFIFSQDHPFAVVWKEGTVRIKYVCMDDFRISKYCGEHLIVGNEVHWEPLDGDDDDDESQADNADESYRPTDGSDGAAGSPASPWRRDANANGSANDGTGATSNEDPTAGEPNDGGEDLRDESSAALVREVQGQGFAGVGPNFRRAARAGEPRAEALQAATVHSFHNLKILKPVDDEALLRQHELQQQQQQQHQQQPHNDTDPDRGPPESDAGRSRGRQRQKVFSQDFRVLKILPSNLDVVEDIKQIGNEYYFKKDVEVVVDDSENEIAAVGESDRGRKPPTGGSEPAVNYSSGTTGDGSEMTETLDIVVLPAPTKDIEIYDNELLPDEAASVRPEDDISVIGLAVPTATSTFPEPKVPPGSTPTPTGGLATVETTLGYWDADRMDFPDPAGDSDPRPDKEPTHRTGFTTGDNDGDGAAPFSFNNRTFQTIQETVRQEFDESQGPFPPLGSYDEGEEDDFDDEDDDGDDGAGQDDLETERRGKDRDDGVYRRVEAGFRPHVPDGRTGKTHKQHMSVQRTLLKHPLRQGFLMTPSYPKYYIGDSTCRWTLHAGVHQRIKLTVLDLALRYDDECRDYLQVVDLNTNQTLFHSCTESSRPIEIVSIEERLEVSVRTTTKVIYPKRGVLIHYTALGCEVPSPTPSHMRLVRRTEHRVKYVCDPLHVFPDTGESNRELICTAKHTWNRPLPACIEKRSTEGSGLVSHYEQKRRYGDSDSMSDKQADTVYDILIPSLIIAGLFIVNGIVFAVIMRYRNKRKERLDLESKELAEL